MRRAWLGTELLQIRLQDTIMGYKSIFRESNKIVLIVMICSLSILLSSCFQINQLPPDAQAALNAYWQSLPSASRVNHQIVRAWRGATSSEEFTSGTAPTQIWCVETQITSSEDLTTVGERLTWIVFQENKTAKWSATLLAAMSSTWPYEACQVGFAK
jgi:hypothetical protein